MQNPSHFTLEAAQRMQWPWRAIIHDDANGRGHPINAFRVFGCASLKTGFGGLVQAARSSVNGCIFTAFWSIIETRK